MNRIKVNILGSNYTLTTDTPESRVREIERELSTKLNEIRDSRANISSVDALVILALNLMDEIGETEHGADRMREQLSEYMEEAGRARTEAEEARREVERLQRELDRQRR
ncbi:MAG: cell division protein ZapA [Angelakisella sp.]